VTALVLKGPDGSQRQKRCRNGRAVFEALHAVAVQRLCVATLTSYHASVSAARVGLQPFTFAEHGKILAGRSNRGYIPGQSGALEGQRLDGMCLTNK
jgi:hypothetical protein